MGVHTDPHASKILVQQMRRLSALRLEADVLVVHGRQCIMFIFIEVEE